MACLCMLTAVPVARAEQAEFAMTVAGCVGRFSAEVEHAWLLQGDQTSILERQREALLSILAAVEANVSQRALLLHRIDVKLAHAALLAASTFGRDKTRALWAQKQSHNYKDRCAGLILDG